MDKIANFITKIKNAGDASHESVSTSCSALKKAIAEVLKKERFIKDFEEKMEKGKKVLVIFLHLENHVSKIKGVQRISKLSKRIYRKTNEIKAVKSGYGTLILSTSHGVMTGKEAKRQKIGGEALFSIW